MIAHPYGVAGLVVNTLGAFGLLFFRPNPFAGGGLTAEQIASVVPKVYAQYQWEIRAYRASVVAMAIGFILQLVDLLIT